MKDVAREAAAPGVGARPEPGKPKAVQMFTAEAREGESFQKSRDSTASLYGVDPLETQELRGRGGRAPQPASKSGKAYPDQSKEGISLPSPQSPSPTLAGSFAATC